jgi:hypothetical protein
MEAIVAECCASGESLVAVAGNGTVVGFVLAKPDRLERFFKKNQALSLRYIGVNKVWRRHGIFSGLMEKSMLKVCHLPRASYTPIKAPWQNVL